MALFLNSCRPEGVLSRKEMSDLLYDVHLSEALMDTTNNPIPDEWKKGLDYKYFRDLTYQSVLRKHGVTEKEFYNSIGYYSKDLRLYIKIYDEVDKRLSEFSEGITLWKFHNPTNAEFFGMYHMDTLKIHTVFTDLNYFNDSTKLKISCKISPDSVPTYAEWKVKCLTHKKIVKPKHFTMLDTIYKNPFYFHMESDSITTNPVYHPVVNQPKELGIVIKNAKGEIVSTSGRKLDLKIKSNQAEYQK